MTRARAVASLVLAAIVFVALAGLIATAADDSPAARPPRAEVLGAQGELATTGEGAAFFTYGPDGGVELGGSATMRTLDGGVHVTVTGGTDGDSASLRATVENDTDGVVAFPGGLAVTVHVGRDGDPWKTVVLQDRTVEMLVPGEQATVKGSLPLDEYGDYELSAEVPYLVP